MALFFALPEPYSLVDSLMGGQNYLNLVVRGATFLAFLALGISLAQVYGAGNSMWVTGRLGISVLILAVAASVVSFMMASHAHSDAGLTDYDTLSVRVYAAIGKIYPAYIAAAFFVPVWKVAGTSGFARRVRWSSGFLGLALGGTLASASGQILACWFPGPLTQQLASNAAYTSVVFFMVGLLLLNTRRWSRGVSQAQSSTPNEVAITKPTTSPASS
ncbi:hypothetical protein [Agreia sp. COWG]|uniref:hypothetical protein n=1 Tax=Agreia sp. COWG TaxID=2773266 RepID=UPI00192572DE|nr:hypothetical protein [Agreia sp. COWG]